MVGDNDNSNKDGDKFIGTSSEFNLTFGDSLYLHPNDTGGSPIVTIKLTGTIYYKMWIISMTFALRNHNKLGVVFAKSAYELWNDLKDTCDKVDGSDVFNLHKNINSLNQNAIRSNIRTRDPLPLVKVAFVIVSGEESHRNINSDVTTKPNATAFATKTFDKKIFNMNNKGQAQTLITIIENFSSNFRPVTSNNSIIDSHSNNANSSPVSNSYVSLYNKQLARLMNLSNDNGVSTANADMSRSKSTYDCFCKKNLVNVIVISNIGLTVGHPNGTQALITKIGDLKINNDITLYDVLVVPEYTVGLLSAHKLSRDRKVFSNDDGTELSPDNQGNDDSEATAMDEINNTHLEGKFNTVRRSYRQTKLPTSLNDFVIEGKVKFGVKKVVSYANLNHENYCFAFSLDKSIEPTCYEEAILDNNWIDAMNAEIEALNKNHTWDITNLPANRKAIGFNQKEGIDFDEMFSPVDKMSTVRCVISLSVNNWPLFQFDVNNAFLYEDLDEGIYMTIPQGFVNKDNKTKVFVKSLWT
uniref:Ribonuclease H-like domain-containing protein n=1 Tax=Tanacetum cinerariifolium TaxID=118510 RepID=A0A699HMN2_TANCI|nr:ribonuclease H-like domain-containing protein [Tanacetum cinerariifolium]